MHRTFAVLFAAMFLAAATPTVQAAQAETVDAAYLSALGLYEPNTGGAALMLCPDVVFWPTDPDYDPVNDPWGDDLDTPYGCDNQDPNLAQVGGTDLFAQQGEYDAVTISAEDDLFGSNAAMATCLWDPDVDHYQCGLDGDHYGSAAGCGTVDLIGAPFLSSIATAFIYNLLVAEDLSVCGGSSGTVSGDFSITGA